MTQVLTRTKELEQSHVCLGTDSYPQSHEDRYVSYILNTILGGSMSSRLFQNVREKRGLAYSVFSGLSAYRDAGNITIYAGCSNEAVGEASAIRRVGYDVLGARLTLAQEINAGLSVSVRVQVRADHGVSVVGEDLRYAAVTTGGLPDIAVEVLDR